METEELTEPKKKSSHKSVWVVLGAFSLCLAVAAGIYFYTSSLKKDLSEPIQAVPADAAFFVQINDYKDFISASKACDRYLNDAFPLRALDGMNYFISLLGDDVQKHPMAFSVHSVDDKMVCLLSARMKESNFDDLLKSLSINEKNNVDYHGVEVFELGTHHRRFFFCFRHGLFSIAENEKLLQTSIDCLASQQCVVQQTNLKPLLDLMAKNTKQNWLVIHHNNFINSQLKNVAPEFSTAFQNAAKLSDWSAYQMAVSQGEISLFGYSTLKEGSLLKRFEAQNPRQFLSPGVVVPAEVNGYCCYNLSDANIFVNSKSVNAQAKNDFLKLQSGEIHYFTMSDTLEYHYFAVKVPSTDTAFVETLLRADCTLDSADAYGILPSDVCGFAGALSAHFASISTPFFIINDDYLVFADSQSALKKYILSIESNNLLKDNQIFVSLSEAGRWAEHTPFQFFFYNHDNALDHYLNPSLISKKSHIRNTKYVLFNCLPICNNLIPNNIYIHFSAE